MRLEGDWPAVRAAVRERRTALGLSTAELARRAQMSETTVRYLGRSPSRGWVLHEIERALGWHRGYLLSVLNGESPEPPAAPVTARLTRIEEKVDELTALVRHGAAPEP